ncbi:MAG TPA: hypothetical protein VEA80_07245 [Vitreimonas sp.]|uniref:hypothetical protein n=1 Tax=Vitreimonas sp. TaxID=3069702 RepID=UPI002D6CF420|nr:hypothetical protein [Vitreimonas sp.]HYD87252.1 hypothetical protein [Vitreimonas sp.]
MGGLDADLLGVVGAMFAVIAGLGLAVAAIAFFRRVRDSDYDFAAGYNALAPLDR